MLSGKHSKEHREEVDVRDRMRKGDEGALSAI